MALVHDQLVQRGGAERVVLTLHDAFPDAPIFTSLYDPPRTFPEFGGADVRSSFLQRFPHEGGSFRAYLPLFAIAFERMRLSGYDVVISSSAGWAHGVRAGDALHVCYWHSPAKWLYRSAEYLGEGSSVPRAARPVLTPVLAGLRRWDARAARRVDVHIANSRFVAGEIRRVYGRDAPIVHPPVSIDWLERAGVDDITPGSYYLVVARLLPYKRVDLAIRACARRGAKLIVVGEGPELASLARLAGDVVSFRSRLGDAELARLYAGATALLQCGKEDFGIVPLEANAAGRPVVAYDAGGAPDTVLDGETGLLFGDQTEVSLGEALDRVERTRWDAAKLRAHSARFGAQRFVDEIRSTIDAARGNAASPP